MNNDKKYLIFIDLIGTLLNKEQEVSNFSIKVLKKLESLGNKIILTSANNYQDVLKIYNKIGLNSLMISNNGGLISNPSNPNEFYFNFNYDTDFFKNILYEIKDFTFGFLYNNSNITYGYNLPINFINRYVKIQNYKYIDIYSIDDVNSSSKLFYLFVSKKNEDYILKYFENNTHFYIKKLTSIFENNLEIIIFEVNLRLINKQIAVKKVIDFYKNKDERFISMAFGDSSNDFEMLKLVDYGIFMVNGPYQLHSYFSFITKYPNYKDGVAKHLLNFFNLNLIE